MMPVTTTPATNIAVSQPTSYPTISKTVSSKVHKFANRVSVSSQTNPIALSSPDLHATPAPKLIAQSELPGGSTPPPAPPQPSIRDTGSGYPTRIPTKYIGPALGFGNGTTAFGAVSRFPLSDSLSLRPSAVFGGGGTVIRVPITYDFIFGDKEPFERNPVVTFNIGGGIQYASGFNNSNDGQFGLLGTFGVDINLFEGIAIVASYNTNFNNVNGTNIGLGFEF